MAIGALLVLDDRDRPPPERVRSLLLRRAATVSRLGQRLVATPPGAGRRVWVEAGTDEVARLVDELPVTLETLGDADGVARALLDATADLVSGRLPLDRPLWRARLLLDPTGRVAGVALVAHHVLADGMGGLAVLGTLADGIPAGSVDGEREAAEPSRRPAAPPAYLELARDAWGSRLRGVRRVGRTARAVGAGTRELGLRRPRLADRCSLLGPTGGSRRLEVATADLAGVRFAAHELGASVNDVVVTAVTGALVDLLARRGERVDELVVSVPVSRRAQVDAGSLGNATGVVPVRVPGVGDPAVRLDAVVGERSRMRGAGRGGSAALLTPAFRALAAVGAFQAFVDHQRLVHTFVTNVRGPTGRLRLAGAEVTHVVPVAVNPGNVVVSFDVLSYAGELVVTLVCDPDAVPESAWLAGQVQRGLRGVGR